MIHATAIIDPNAQLGNNVSVGPYSVIGPQVVIGDNCRIESHVVVKGPTRIGRNNRIFQFASVGEECQDKKYAGEDTRLIIGDDNVFRESVTIHRGTVQDNNETRIGHRNLFMAYVHVAHDCVVGDDNILANNATIAGHVHVGDWAILGGFTGVHQFCHIGSHSFCGVGSVVVKDVPPYVTAAGQNAVPYGINGEGLKRRGFSAQAIMAIKRAYKVIYRQGNSVDEAIAKLQYMARDNPEVGLLGSFLEASPRGIIR